MSVSCTQIRLLFYLPFHLHFMQTFWPIYINTFLGMCPNLVLLPFFFPTSPLNLLQFCFATHRVRKNCSSTLSPLSRSNNSISCQCKCFQVFCSQVSTYKGLSHAATGGLGEKTADRYFCCLVLLLSLL